jgi:hypothetical protein
MRKMKTQYVICTIVFCLASSNVFAGDSEKTTLSQFLHSNSVNERQKAFTVIIVNDNKYRDLILTELEVCSNKPDKTPDALLYLAAYIRDQRYIRPLSKLINNVNYSAHHCIYQCTIVFSLVIFSSFTDYSLPVLNDKLVAVRDLKSEREMVKNISIELNPAYMSASGPGIDQLLDEMEALPISEVIKIAGPETADANKRFAAAIVLQAHAMDDRYLKELYWLAIEDIPNAATSEYRGAIHWAIYKAETYRKLNKP